MQLADVVQKHQCGEPLAHEWSQTGAGCRVETISNNRETQHPQKHGGNVHRMMGERVVFRALDVDLSPRRPYQDSEFLCLSSNGMIRHRLRSTTTVSTTAVRQPLRLWP